jgi:thiol-disulfide isomerase/thioredoxin
MTGFRPLEQFEFHHTLDGTPGVSVVMFSARGCGACRSFKSMLEDYQQQHPDLHLFLVDAERDGALVREFDVFHLPALFLFVDGRYHRPLQCEARTEAFAAALGAARAAPALEAP